MALTDTAIKNAKPLSKQYRLTDGLGLYLLVRPNGSKLWRQDYRFAAKDKTLSVGIYPDVSLKLARERRDEIRSLVAQDIDPSLQRKTSKLAQTHLSANTFETIAREWFARQATAWAKSYSSKIIQRLERDIFPWLGASVITDISAPELLAVIRKIETRGKHETAHRALQNCSQIFRYAIATGRAQRDPSGDLRGALAPIKKEHFAAITDPKQAAELLKAIDIFDGTYVVKTALQLAPLVFVRPGELRQAKWENISLDTGEWTYTVSKTNTEHLVPLSTQAIDLLKELLPIDRKQSMGIPQHQNQHQAHQRHDTQCRPTKNGLQHQNRDDRPRF